jgi:hypothetical protein
MSAPEQARPAGNRNRIPRHAKAGPESVVASFPQQASLEAAAPEPPGVPPDVPPQVQPHPEPQSHPNLQTHQELHQELQSRPELQPYPEPQPQPQPHSQSGDVTIMKRVARSKRYWLALFAGGTIATALSIVRALGWPADARPGAGPGAGVWVAAVIAVGVASAFLGAITCMYRERQETKRKEIDQNCLKVVAAALARSIDATHTMARGLPPAKEMVEAARVRDSARQVSALLAPAIATLLQASRPAAGPGEPETAAGTAPGQLIDPVRMN